MSFAVTYEIVTAEYGEVAKRGWISRDESLRDAVQDLFDTEEQTDYVECVEASCSDYRQARWMTVYNGPYLFADGYEIRSLHFPESITASSRVRLVRLLGGRG